jgi:hypothetical protein
MDALNIACTVVAIVYCVTVTVWLAIGYARWRRNIPR